MPKERVAGLERMVGTFVPGFAVSEANGRFGEGGLDTRERRERLGPEELPAHHRLGDVLDLPVDWDAECEEGMARSLEVVEKAGFRGGADERT
ncbi:hypothetical protein [Nocardiopsis sp. ATB16-24]|uniref:hypothetical protein n=1 Tax=Nocardiopsis sp. ATB16-24 TaxID=3019555 RepID=UPI0025551AF0|nr:hypothetical protein [Nocardiopsis sp. ATB16-24]